jgi:hypothetical protein
MVNDGTRMPGKEQDTPYDWERFWVHFICGALFGAFFGFLFWLSNWTPGLSLWLCVGVASFSIALLGGVFGDRFWYAFLRMIGRLW